MDDYSRDGILLVSLHDVAPVHLERLRRAEALFKRLDIRAVQYLFVPEFHGRYRASEFPEFLEWCRRDRGFSEGFDAQWCLHGYYHQERRDEKAAAVNLTWEERLKRRFLTAGEGEFLVLDPAEQKRRLEAGLAEFAHCLTGVKPAGFVAPAWLYKPELLPLLKEFNLPFTEGHHRIFRVNDGASLSAPVITWATRTSFHKHGSLFVCPLRAWWFRNSPLLRVALHPHDFDHPETEASIERVLAKLVRRRSLKHANKLDWERLLFDSRR